MKEICSPTKRRDDSLSELRSPTKRRDDSLLQLRSPTKRPDPELQRIQHMRYQIDSMYSDMFKKMKAHDDVTVQYKDRQEQCFLKIFQNVMQKISQELKAAQQRYQNIDFEIQKDERIQKLQKEVYYFRQQCVCLTEKMKVMENEMKKLKEEMLQTQQEKREQYELLLRRTRERKRLKEKLQKSGQPTKRAKSNQKSLDNHLIMDGLTCTVTNFSQTTKNLRVKNARNLSFGQQETTKNSIVSDKQTDKQNLLEIWRQCVATVKTNNPLLKFLAKQTKLNTIKQFFTIDRVFQILEKQLQSSKEPLQDNTTFKEPKSSHLLKRKQPLIGQEHFFQKRPESTNTAKQPYRKVRQNLPIPFPMHLHTTDFD